MNKIQIIAKNMGLLFVSQIVSYILGFFTLLYVARYLGADGFGILSLALSITAILGIVADLGLGTLTVREVARNKSLASKYISNIAIIRIPLSLLTFGIVGLIVYILNYPEPVSTVIYIITLSMIINVFTGTLTSIFQANEKMEHISISIILNCILLFVGTIVGIYYNMNILFFAFLYVISNTLVFVYILIMYLLNFSFPSTEIDIHSWKPIIKEALFFGSTSFLVSIYFYIDSILLSVMNGNYEVGIYNAAYRLIFVLLFIPNVVILSLFPVMSRHFESYKDLLKLEYEKMFKYLFVIAIFIFAIGFVFANKIIIFIYGSEFINAIIVLQALIFVVPVIFITSLFGNVLGATNRQRFVTIVACANAVLNIILNIILIPKYSYIGASVATVLTETLGFILMYIYISHYVFKISIIKNLLKTIISGFLVVLFLYYIKTELNWVLASILGLLIYLVFLYVLNIINKHDIKLLKQIIE